jgi:hypothetical protein
VKKIIAFLIAATLLVCITPKKSDAQINKSVTLSKASVSGTDTATATITADDYVKSFTVVATKTSGTVAGKIYFYGSGDGTNYDKLDSLTMADAAGAQFKTFKPLLPLVYYKYKVTALSTGGVWTVALKQLERTK